MKITSLDNGEAMEAEPELRRDLGDDGQVGPPADDLHELALVPGGVVIGAQNRPDSAHPFLLFVISLWNFYLLF